MDPFRRGIARRRRPRAATGEGHLRRRLLLVHRGSVREGARRDQRRLRIHRRQGEEPELRAGVGRPYRPRRGGAGDVRSEKGQLRKAARRLLAEPRPDGERSSVLRCRLAIPPGDLLHLARAEAPRRGIKGEVGEGAAFPPADPHRDHAGERLLSGGGISPGLLQEEFPAVQVLRHGLRPLQPAGQSLGRPAQKMSSGTEPELDRAPSLNWVTDYFCWVWPCPSWGTFFGLLSAGSSPFAFSLPTRSAFCIAWRSCALLGSALRAASSTLPESTNFFVRSL